MQPATSPQAASDGVRRSSSRWGAPPSSDLIVVHSDPGFRRAVRDLAARRGLRCCETDSPVTGVLLARESNPGAMILDLEIPGMDGLLALTLLREQAGDALRLGVVVAGVDGRAELAREAGADAVFSGVPDAREIDLLLETRASERRRGRSTVGSLP